MRTWTILLGGMIVWTAHFFALYFIGSIFLSTSLARWLVVVATLLCVAADLRLFFWIRARRDMILDGWAASVGLVLTGLSLVAVVWQGLPALL